MSEEGYQEVRQEVVVNPTGRVTISFELTRNGIEDIHLEAVPFCVGCYEPFTWDETQRWYTCSLCGVELTTQEALLLAGLSSVALKTFQTLNQQRIDASPANGAKKKWDWRKWFGLSKTSSSSKT